MTICKLGFEVTPGVNSSNVPCGTCFQVDLSTAVESDPVWLSSVSAARDSQEQNLEAVRREGGKIFYKTLRAIRAEEELRVWYSQDLEQILGIPDIQPFCVKGTKNSIFSKCDVASL